MYYFILITFNSFLQHLLFSSIYEYNQLEHPRLQSPKQCYNNPMKKPLSKIINTASSTFLSVIGFFQFLFISFITFFATLKIYFCSDKVINSILCFCSIVMLGICLCEFLTFLFCYKKEYNYLIQNVEALKQNQPAKIKIFFYILRTYIIYMYCH